jgi:hypothetical protein
MIMGDGPSGVVSRTANKGADACRGAAVVPEFTVIGHTANTVRNVGVHRGHSLDQG